MVHKTKKGQKGITLTAKEADAKSKANRAKAKKVTTLPKVNLRTPIKLKKKSKFIEAGKKILGKTTIVAGVKTQIPISTKLAAGTAALPTPFGKAKAGTAIVSATVAGHRLIRTTAGAEKLVGFGVRQATRNFVGRPSIPKNINKLFHAVRPTASRFASNGKTQGLTKSLLSKGGLSIGATSLLVGAIGTYPFAGFIKEEAIQTLGFAFNTAERNNDIEGMENAIAETDEILNNAPSVLDKVPFANVLVQLKAFYKAAAVKLENDRSRLESLRGEQEEGETAFQVERREADEAAFERKREFGEEETERFEGIRKANEQRELDELNFKEQYFALIRESKFDQAAALLDIFEVKLKGGN